MKNNEIRITVNAEQGSRLEQVVFRLLKDAEENRKRIIETFLERKEKQNKKIERRL
jgi:hypothetical protein